MGAFPDVRWGSENSRLRKPMARFGKTRLGSATIRVLTPLDRRLLTRTKGRATILGPIGAPTMLLTTTGAKSGLARTTPLLYARESDDALIVVGSNFGQQHHPAWTGNLKANPDALVTIGGKDVPVRAVLLEGAEAEEAYRKMVDLVDTYGEYRNRTDRQIRVFRLAAV